MRFAKYHGLGNDFILAEAAPEEFSPEDVRRLCHRRLGIGADGLVLLTPSQAAAIGMRIYNSDGSEAEMCGNAIRCAASYAFARGLARGSAFTIETLAGVKEARLSVSHGKVTAVEVDMGAPRFDRPSIPMAGEGEFIMQPISALGREFAACAANTGVPHLTVFLQDVTEEEILRYGPALERHPLFPRGTNVNFARVRGSGAIAVDTYERGCGRTPACGTGACAAAVCAARAGLAGREADAILSHGSLRISWREDGHIYMSGPAEEVYAGDCPFF